MNLVEKYLGGGVNKKLSNQLLRKVMNYLDARFKGSENEIGFEKELKKELGDEFTEVVFKHGDPRKVRYAAVKNKWMSTMKTDKPKTYGYEGPTAGSKMKSYGYKGPQH